MGLYAALASRSLACCLAAALSLCPAASGAVGDWVEFTLRDGRTLEGKVVEETEFKIVIDYYHGSVPVKWTFAKSEILDLTVKEGADDAEVPDVGTPGEDGGERAEPERGGFAVVPARGSIGHVLSVQFFTEAMDYADRKDAEVLVFHLESPGGYVQTLKGIRQAIDEHESDLRVAFYVDSECFSAAALLCISNEYFFVGEGAAFGAAVHITGAPGGGLNPVEAKMMAAEASIWRAHLESLGRPGIVTDAMIMMDVEVWADTSRTPWRLYRARPASEDTGDDAEIESIDTPRTVLALTREQVVGMGVCTASAASPATAARMMGLNVDQEAFDGRELADRIHDRQERMLERIVSRFDACEEAEKELSEDRRGDDGISADQLRSYCSGQIRRLNMILREIRDLPYLAFYLKAEHGITEAVIQSWIDKMVELRDKADDIAEEDEKRRNRGNRRGGGRGGGGRGGGR